MYTIQENVRIVIAMLKQYNIRHIVVNPGGTNIPISQAVQDDPFFHCYSIPDERSAMYFAIGLHLQTGEVIATSCTSAQATRNYVPGLTEAFYKHTPIIAITTSKLQRYQYQEYMQAPDQCSLPKDAVKKSFDLPPVTDENTRMQCYNQTLAALLEVTHRSPGPVQLNIRITDALQSKFDEVQLPRLRSIHRYMAWEDWSDINLSNKKVLIIIGEHRPFTERQQIAIDRFCESHNAVVYINHLSNYHGKYAIQGNLLVASGGLQKLKPDVFITIGGQTGDYPIYSALNQIKAEHWRVSEEGDFVDTYNQLTKIFECPDYFFFEKTQKDSTSTHEYYNAWRGLNETMDYQVANLPLSNLYIAQQLHKDIPQGSIMNFAILNSLRCWSYFPLDASIQGYGNVAAFGIDGCNSMLIGESMNTEDLCFIVTGDLAYFYDMNALGIRHIKNNVRILLINNEGGAEFRIMTAPWKKNIDVTKYIAADGHNGTTKGWAEACDFVYLSASTKEEFLAQKTMFLQINEKPIVFEIFTDGDDEVRAIQQLLERNNLKEKTIKDYALSILGEKGVEMVKSILRK